MTRTREEKEKMFMENRSLVFHILKRYKIPQHVDFDDVLQVGYMALWRCINDDGFDPSKGKPATYFGKYIETDVRNFLWENVDNDGFCVNSDTRRMSSKVKALRRQRLSDEEIAEEIYINGKRPIKVARVKAMANLGKPSEALYCTDADGEEYDNPKLPKVTDADEYDEIENDELHSALQMAMDKHLNRYERDVLRMVFGFDSDNMPLREIAKEMGKSDSWVSIQRNKGLAKLRHPRCSKALSEYR